jgi:uncharacterized protein
VSTRDQKRKPPAPPRPALSSELLLQLNVREHDGGASFELRVQPRAARVAVLGVHAGALKLSLTAAPVDGAANDALLRVLADLLGVARADLRMLRGERSRQKAVHVRGLTAATLRARLEAAGA